MPLQAIQRAEMQPGSGSFRPTLMPQAVPEDAPLVVDYSNEDGMEDDALKAYMARSKLLHHGLAFKASGANVANGGTRMRY